MTDVAELGTSVTLTGAAEADKQLLRFAASAAKAENAAASLARPINGLRDASGKFVSANKLASDTLDRSKKSADAYSNSVEMLRAKYVPLFAATRQYEAELRNINAALQLGALSDREAAAAKEVLTRAYAKSAGAADLASASIMRMGRASDLSSDSMVRLGRSSQGGAGGLQNVGYQVQDFAVQVGAGTSATQALSQQLPQLLSGFGLFGVLAGTAAAILLPIAGYLMGSAKQAKSLSDAMDVLTSSIDSYQTFIIRAGQSTIELRGEFGKFTDQIIGFSEFLAGVQLGQSFDDLKLSIDPLKGSLSEFQLQMIALAESQAAFNAVSTDGFSSAEMIFQQGQVLELYKTTLQETASSMGLTVDQATALASALDAVGKAKTMEEIAAAAGRALSLLREIDATGVGLPPSLRAAAIALDEMQTKAAAAAKATKDLANSAPTGAWMNPAAGSTNFLINRIDAAIGRAEVLKKVMASATATTPGQGVLTAPGQIDLNQPTGGAGRINLNMGSGGGGGGGGGADPYQSNLDNLMTSLMTERETVEKWYADSEVLLNDRRAREQMGEAAHKEAMLALEVEYQDRIKGVKDGAGSTWLTDTSKLFGDLNTLAGGGYDALLKAQKGFAAAEALINTYRAAAQVLADPKMSFWMKFAAVAKVVAAGMGLVNAIKGGSKSKGGGSGSIGSAGSAAQAPAPERVVRVSFQGDPFMTQMAESMMTQIYDASKGGRVIIAR